MKKNKRQKSSQPVNQIKQKKISVKKTEKNIPALAIIIALVTFFLNIFLIPDKAELLFFKINSYFFYILNLFLSGLIFYSLSNKKHSENIAKYSFLLLLISSILLNFFKGSSKSPPDLINLHEQLSLFATFIILPAIVLGVIALWLDKNKLRTVINNIFSEDKPKIKLFSKPELPYTGTFIIILGISVITLFYRLDGFDLYSDETQVTQGAAGYLYSGEFYQYNFATQKLSTNRTYNRARPHQWLIAQSYKIFGVSNWSSRLPSAIFGLLLTALGYFISRFFIRDKLSALLISFSFVFYFEFLQLERWARMYALLIPVYLFTAYLLFRFINEKSYLVDKKFRQNQLITEYLNFNYLLLLVVLPFLILIYYLHTPAVFVLVVLYIYAIVGYLVFRDKKFLTMIFVGLILGIIGYNTIPNVNALDRINFFTGKYSDLYTHFFFNYPFSVQTGIVLTIIAVALLFFIKNNSFRKIYIYLLINVAFGWFLFAYLIKYSASFRYMSFLSPLVIILLISTFVLVIKTLYNKAIRIFLLFLLSVSVLFHYSNRFDNLYVKNYAFPARMSVAWKDIVSNYKKGEIIYRHWGPSYYFRGIDTTAKFMELGSRQGKPFAEIYDTLKKYPSGWLTWHSYHAWRMDPKLVDYANLYFEKLHGQGIDNTNVEVFHYTDSMLVDTIRFQFERLIPYANLNLRNTCSIGFWINIDKTNNNPPFLFLNNNENILYFGLDKNKSFKISYQNKQLSIPDFPVNKWHYLTFIQNAKDKTFSIYLNGQQIQSKSFIPEQLPIVKFKVNPQFKGQLDDIRIYNIALNSQEIMFIMKNRNNTNSENIWFNDKPLNTLYHWKKK